MLPDSPNHDPCAAIVAGVTLRNPKFRQPIFQIVSVPAPTSCAPYRESR